ncbi:hypothetical protein ACFQQB_22295 [Nonomuraea rubra]|uniref:hypothetical protein n=1 Tax=Nonomuraea rubra TaxID=46180 RepID=UPI003609FE51
MKVSLVLASAYAMRGDVRATLNLATALAERHDVEVISVRRQKEKPFFPVGPKVSMRSVVDARPGSGTCCRAGRCVPRWRCGGCCATSGQTS